METINTFGNTEEEQKAIDEKDLKQKLDERTRIPGTFTHPDGTRELPLQRKTDAEIEELEVRVGLEYISGELQKRFKNKPLSPIQTRIYFQSDTDDAGGKTNASFLAAKDMGDWNWKDDGDYLYYDNRYKKYRKT